MGPASVRAVRRASGGGPFELSGNQGPVPPDPAPGALHPATTFDCRSVSARRDFGTGRLKVTDMGLPTGDGPPRGDVDVRCAPLSRSSGFGVGLGFTVGAALGRSAAAFVPVSAPRPGCLRTAREHCERAPGRGRP
jgi:hypothetical protein